MTPRPLSEAQLGLWYAQRLDPSNPVFNTGQYVEIVGALEVETFQRAVNTAIAEADALSLRIEDTADGPQQTVDDARRPRLQVIDWRNDADARTRAGEWMRRDMATPIDFATAPLAVEVLFRLTDEHAIWYQRIHHVAIDGYGTALLVERICDLYTAGVSGTPPTTSPFRPFADVLTDHETYRASPALARDRAFWQAQFADRPTVESFTPKVSGTAHTYLTQHVDLPPSLGPALAACAAAAKVTWPDAAVALSAAYLRRHIGQPDAILGVPAMERLGRPAARVPSMVMNILPIRLTVDEALPMPAFLAGVASHLRLARRHGRYRSEQLRRDLGLLGGERRLYGPLVNVLPFDRPVTLGDLKTTLHVLGTGPVDDMTITVRSDASTANLRIELDANPELYAPAVLAAHADRFAQFLDRAAHASSLAEMATLTPSEHRQWTVAVNDTAHDVERTTLTDLIERQMRASPDATALVSDDGEWTYRAFDERSAAVAAALAARDVRRGDVVAVLMPRSRELVLALVGVLRAGAAYLPLDPAYPRERIAATLGLSAPRLVLTVASTRGLLDDDVPQLPIETVPSHVSTGETAAFIAHRPKPEDAAYVIYTSGSTGVPKGVVNEHHAIVNRLEWMRAQYGIAADDRILQKTPATFDVSVWEFFLPLIAGATLVVAPADAHRDPAWLASVVRERRVTTMHFVPSMLAVFLDEPAVRGLTLRRVFCSGEELPAALRDRFHQHIRAELHNLYGPTEAAVDVTYWECDASDRSVPVPIGRPVWNTQMYVLDERLRPVPPDVAGHLYIGGVQVARGYLGRDDLTAERFLPNPFAPGRIYKTGDLARWRSDGALVFLGRSDFQVKIRGLRIELGEIEACLASHPSVAQAVVVAHPDRTAGARLVAYVVPRAASAGAPSAWRQHVAERLPDYMIPSAFVVLASLPLSPNGKLERKALPIPDVVAAPATPLTTPTEDRLSVIFADVLRSKAPIGGDTDFFDLGGHSLLGASVMQRVRSEWPCDLGLGALFAAPTVARLAARIDAAVAGHTSESLSFRNGLGPLVLVAGHGSAEHPPLFCIHPAGGISWCYATLGRALRPARAVFGVQTYGLDPDAPLPDSLTGMAREYVRLVREEQPAGPYALAGWSVGGIIAHAMAIELQTLGEQVGVLAMLDAYPSDRWRGAADPDERAALRALLLIAGQNPDAIDVEQLTRTSVVAFLKESGHPLGDLPARVLEGIVRTVGHNNRLVRRHHHERFDGQMLFFRAALDHAGLAISPDEWRPYVTGMEIHDVPSLHAHMTGPGAASHIAPVLDRWLR